MKKIKFITLTILMLMLTVFTLTNIKTKDIEVKATETQEVNLKIYKNNVSYSSELYILYAVSYGDLEINKYEVQLLFFDTLQEEYVKGNEAYVAKSRGTTTVGGVKCLTFYSNGIAAKQMVDDIYTVAYVNINGVDYYSEVDKFSVLEYAHKALEEGAVNPHQRRLLQDLLKYGGAAQNVFDHNTHRPADATYYKITVIDGKLPDGFNHGRFQENETVVITPIDKEGFKFSHWTDEEGIIVSYDKEFEITVTKKKEFTANYKDITSISSQLKMNLTVDYDTTIEEIDFPTAVSFEYGEKTITLGITWDTTKFIENQIGVQKLYATLEDESAYEEYGISKEDIYLEINVLAYVFELNSETGEYKIVKYYGTEEKVEIPTTYNNTAISYICNKAFNENLNIKELIIPNSITYIEQGAIYYCDNIESITIPFTGRSEKDYFSWDYSYFGYIFGATSYSTQNVMLPRQLKSVIIAEGATQVTSYAFRECTSLISVILPKSITSINNDAFYNCKSLEKVYYNGTFENWLNVDISSGNGSSPFRYSAEIYMKNNDDEYYQVKEVILPNDITKIGSEQLAGFDMTSITIPNNVTSIDREAFYNCESLKKVTFEEGSKLKTINGRAFMYCELLEEIIIPEGVTTIEHTAFFDCTSLESVVIPEGVTSIEGSTFYNCTSLTNITIPSGVTSIGSNAFYNCTSLTNITIPSSVTSIESAAFYNCSSLTNITIPSGVTSIESSTFYKCTSLTNITISNRVRNIGSSAFYNCASLEYIYYEGTIEDWCNITFNGYYSNPMQNVAHFYIRNINNEWEEVTELVIPEYVTELTSIFAGCSSITKITIPNTVLSIESSAFKKMNNLETVIFEEGSKLTSINSGTFNACTALKEIIIPNGVTSIGSNAFYNCTSLTNITIPSSVITIGSNAFENCTSLTNITIPSSVTSIESSAFRYCTSLTNITIPSSVTTIGSNAFENCTSLTNITIPSGVTSIGSSAFDYCKSLTNITIPSSVTTIGSNAFYNCYSLKEVYNESDLVFTPGSSEYGNIAYYALKVVNKGEVIYKDNATVYEYVTTEDGFKFLNFNNTYYLISYTGTDEVPTLPALVNGKTYKCQYMDSTLKNIKLSTDFTSIHKYMFQCCSHLESIEIPNSITTIGDLAFSNCTSLTNITIPSSVTSIGYDAFSNCASLTNVTFEEGSKLTTIGTSAFSGCKSLTNITIPSSVTSIGSYAFYNCTSLTNITIPSSVTSIGSYAFYICPSLTIYCEAESQPSGWNSDWNNYNRPVVWGHINNN